MSIVAPTPEIPGTGTVPDLEDIQVPKGTFSHAFLLDEAVPLALFPVRLEARFVYPQPDAPYPELLIRVYPDLVHADGHTLALTAREIALGTTFWNRWWYAASEADREQGFAFLSGVLGPWRAAWVAKQLKPTNFGDAPAPGVSSPPPPAPLIPVLTPVAALEPGYAKLLPDRWAVVLSGHDGDTELFWGETIPRDLKLAPALIALENGVDAKRFLDDQGLAWMYDFAEAEKVGMGIRIDLTTINDIDILLANGFKKVLVFGVRNTLTNGQLELAEVLEAHHFSHGVDFVPQGTPTNNTDTVTTGISVDAPDLVHLFDAEIAAPPAAAALSLTSLPSLYVKRAADAATLALGLEGNPVFNRVEHADVLELDRAKAMNQALWPATWRYFFTTMFDGVVTGANLTWLRNWFVDYVRGGGVLPTLRIGPQPYGVLPVCRLVAQSEPADEIGELERVLSVVTGTWWEAWTSVPHLDPNAIDPSNIPGQESSEPVPPPSDSLDLVSAQVSAVLGAVPHPIPNLLRAIATSPLDVVTETDPSHQYDDLVNALGQTAENAPWYLEKPFESSAFWVNYSDADDAAGKSLTYNVYSWLQDELAAATTIEEQVLAYERACGIPLFTYPGLADTFESLSKRTDRAPEQQAVDTTCATLIAGPHFATLGVGDGYDGEENCILKILTDHQDRVRPAADIGLGLASTTFKPELSDDPALFYADVGIDPETNLVTGTSEVWTGPLVAAGREDADLQALATWIAGLVDKVDVAGVPSEGEGWDEAAGEIGDGYTSATEAPLLRHLLEHAVENVAEVGESSLRAGLNDLHAIVTGLTVEESRLETPPAATPPVADPVGELERLMRETLGLASHRLDAWYTSIAAYRLAEKRSVNPTGLQIGGYGWLIDLKPSTSQTQSQGFIHAPTMNHAATAAVLRSGWTAFSGEGESAPLAVDLRSNRIRQAKALLDGVRSGLDLADLLGTQLERLMHDRGLDAYVENVRRAVLVAAGRPGQPATSVVDGLTLARAFSGATDLTALETATLDQVTADVLAAVPGDSAVVAAEKAAVDQTLRQLVSLLDAAADSTMAQSVHDLLLGNTDAAAATLNAMSSGEAATPDLRFARLPRQGQNITHKVVVLLPEKHKPGTWSGARTSALALASPQLEKWVGDLLPLPTSIAFQATWWVNGVAYGAPVKVTLAALAAPPKTVVPAIPPMLLSALEAIYLCPAGDALDGSALAARLACYVAMNPPVGIDVGATVSLKFDRTGLAATDVSLDELALLARPLRRLLGRGSVMDARGLATSETDTPDGAIDVGELEKNRLGTLVKPLAGSLRQALTAARTALANALPLTDSAAPRGDLHRTMLGLAPFFIRGAVPTAGFRDRRLTATGGDIADRNALVAEARVALAAADARIAEVNAQEVATADWNVWTADQKVASLTARIQTLAGRPVPVPPVFTPAKATTLAATFGKSASRLGTPPLAASKWLGQVARVREGVAPFHRAIDLGEALRDATVARFIQGQLPSQPYAGSELEPWVATGKPSKGSSWTSWLAMAPTTLSFADAMGNGQRMVGFQVDAWSETIPRSEQATGIAFHFDAPSARPPQAILLGVPRPGVSWSIDEVKQLLWQTLDLARLRAVDPHALQTPAFPHHYNQYLPAIYLNGDTHPGPAEET